jgi:undecaprenyl-diphosphatase
MLETLLEYDKELFLFLNNLGRSTWDGFWLFITNKWSSIPVYFVLLILCFKQFGLKKTVALIVAVALLIASTNGLADFFKYGIQRLRPCYDMEVSELMRLVKASCGGKFGYFSAHAANSFSVAIFITILLRSKYAQIGIFLVVWAIFIAYSRIYIGVHFPLDVLSGVLIGSLFGWIFAKLFIFALHKFPL